MFWKRCKICNMKHEDRERLEAMLLLDTSFSEIERQFDGVNRMNIYNHQKHWKRARDAIVVDPNSTQAKREKDRIETLAWRKKVGVTEEDFEEPRWIKEYKKIRRVLTPWENRW